MMLTIERRMITMISVQKKSQSTKSVADTCRHGSIGHAHTTFSHDQTLCETGVGAARGGNNATLADTKRVQGARAMTSQIVIYRAEDKFELTPAQLKSSSI